MALVYAQVQDLKDFAVGRALPSDDILTDRLEEAQDDIDSILIGTLEDNGRKIDVTILDSSREDALTKATCQQAIWRLSKGADYFDNAGSEEIQGPDYTIKAGSYRLIGPSAMITLRSFGFLRNQTRGSA